MNLRQRLARIFNPWHGGEHYLVYRERDRIQQIAKRLSKPGQRLKVRFNGVDASAQLYSGSRIVADILISGKGGVANLVSVINHTLSPLELEELEAFFAPLEFKTFGFYRP